MTDRAKVIRVLEESVPFLERIGYSGIGHAVHDALELLQAPEIVRCKDCKHRGIMAGKTSFDIQWPDGDCPCRSDDPYYSWLPPDDWYCANGEREVKNDV